MIAHVEKCDVLGSTKSSGKRSREENKARKGNWRVRWLFLVINMSKASESINIYLFLYIN